MEIFHFNFSSPHTLLTALDSFQTMFKMKAFRKWPVTRGGAEVATIWRHLFIVLSGRCFSFYETVGREIFGAFYIYEFDLKQIDFSNSNNYNNNNENIQPMKLNSTLIVNSLEFTDAHTPMI